MSRSKALTKPTGDRSRAASPGTHDAPSVNSTIGPRPKLVNPAHFLLATRDSGYRSSVMAVAELIDNSIQAGARQIRVSVDAVEDPDYPIEISVSDDGSGMDVTTLADALT